MTAGWPSGQQRPGHPGPSSPGQVSAKLPPLGLRTPPQGGGAAGVKGASPRAPSLAEPPEEGASAPDSSGDALGDLEKGPSDLSSRVLERQPTSLRDRKHLRPVAVLPGGTNLAEPSPRSRRGLGAEGGAEGPGAEGGAPAEGRLWEASWGLSLTMGETSGSPPPSFPAPRCLSHAHTMQTCVPTLVCTPRTEPLHGRLHSHVQAHRWTHTLHAHALTRTYTHTRMHAQAPVLTRPLSAGSIWSTS